MPAASWQDVHPEKRMSFAIDGSLWVPVEVTLVEKSDFLTAWRRGVEEWEAVADSPDDRRFVETADAQKVYRPIGLQQTDLGLQYGNPQTVAPRRTQRATSAEKLVTAIVDAYGQSRQDRRNQARVQPVRSGLREVRALRPGRAGIRHGAFARPLLPHGAV